MTTFSGNNASGSTSANSQSLPVVNISGNNIREPAIVSSVSSVLPLSATIALVPGASVTNSNGIATSTGTSNNINLALTSSTPEFHFLLPKILEKLEKKAEDTVKDIERKKSETADFCSDVLLEVINFSENPCDLAIEAIEYLVEDERNDKELKKKAEIEIRREASKRRVGEKDRNFIGIDPVELTKGDKSLSSDKNTAISGDSNESSPDREASVSVTDCISSDIVDDLATINISATPRERVPSTTKRANVKIVRPKSQIRPSTAKQNSEAR